MPYSPFFLPCHLGGVDPVWKVYKAMPMVKMKTGQALVEMEQWPGPGSQTSYCDIELVDFDAKLGFVEFFTKPDALMMMVNWREDTVILRRPNNLAEFWVNRQKAPNSPASLFLHSNGNVARAGLCSFSVRKCVISCYCTPETSAHVYLIRLRPCLALTASFKLQFGEVINLVNESA